MSRARSKGRGMRGVLWALTAMAAAGSTGCQANYNGQTLPSPWYIKDDVQYFPPGSEFILSKEAAAAKALTDDQAAPGQP